MPDESNEEFIIKVEKSGGWRNNLHLCFDATCGTENLTEHYRARIRGTIGDAALSSAEVPAPGTHVHLDFTEDLDLDTAHLPRASAFTVSADGVDNAVTAVEARSGVTNGVALALERAIFTGQSVTVGYTDPSDGDDANPTWKCHCLRTVESRDYVEASR